MKRLELDWTVKTGNNWKEQERTGKSRKELERAGKNWKEQERTGKNRKELERTGKNWKEQNWTGRFETNGTSFRFICKNRFLSLGATMKS